jgi:hypothetical protein
VSCRSRDQIPPGCSFYVRENFAISVVQTDEVKGGGSEPTPADETDGLLDDLQKMMEQFIAAKTRLGQTNRIDRIRHTFVRLRKRARLSHMSAVSSQVGKNERLIFFANSCTRFFKFSYPIFF